jgi:hypothetical protein
MYRDPLQSAQSQVERAFEQAAEREEQVSPVLIEQLSASMRAKLRKAQKRAMQERSGLDGLRESEKALLAYADILDRVLAQAPRIEKRFNRLPRFFPDRIKPRHPFLFADVYSPGVDKLRQTVHSYVNDKDEDASIHDRRPRYFDHHVNPFLVDACFKAHDAPVRLHVVPSMTASAQNNLSGYNMMAYLSMLTLVRSSTPHVVLERQHWGKRLLKLVRLQDDTEVGRPKIDDMFVISALPEDAQRVLTDEVCGTLLELARSCVPTLDIKDGLARLEWSEKILDTDGIDAACRVLAAIRRVAPTPLLARKRPR